MSVQSHQTPPNASWKQGFFRRLAIYLFGIALGCLLLAMLQMARSANLNKAAPVPVPTTPAK